jgi:hypothetical protein
MYTMRRELRSWHVSTVCAAVGQYDLMHFLSGVLLTVRSDDLFYNISQAPHASIIP